MTITRIRLWGDDVKIKRNMFDIVLNTVCLLVLLGLLIYLAVNWSGFPEKIPGHYNAMGEVDRWGNKGELLLLPILAWIIYFGVTGVEKFPQIWNTGVAVTVKNKERVYRMLKNMIETVKLLVVTIFAFLSVNATLARQLPAWFLPVFLILTFGAIGVFVIKLIRLQ